MALIALVLSLTTVLTKQYADNIYMLVLYINTFVIQRAAKEGFNFKESKEKPGSFVSLKLGYVTVTVRLYDHYIIYMI